jgi:hypothetical protein
MPTAIATDLAQPTRMVTTSAGFWGLYEVGDQVLVVHPGAADDVPRSRVEQGPPPTYDLSDERNAP